jgi:hypothetical protein
MSASTKGIVWLCMLALIAGCPAWRMRPVPRRGISTMNDKIDLARRTHEIAEGVGDLLTTPDVLFHLTAFLQIYEAPDALVEQAAQIYADSQASSLQKEITGYAMQRLSLEKFIWLVSGVALLVEQDRVPGQLLDQLAFPPLNWGAQLALNWDRADVKALLLRLAALKQLNDWRRTYIRDRVLTGKAQAEYLDLKEAGQIP